MVLYHLWFNVESHLPHPYSVSLNFPMFSMLSVLNHWRHANNENISICNVAYTHFRVHLSQYLYISHRMLKSRRVIARIICAHICGSVQSQEKRLGFLAQPTQNEEKPIWNSDCTVQMCLRPMTPKNHLNTEKFTLFVLLDLSVFFKLIWIHNNTKFTWYKMSVNQKGNLHCIF